jgi:CheY-like chemotaxis protein
MAMARILIVEDEPIVALNYASILEEAGYEIVGPVGTIRRAFVAIESEHIDGAVLDIDIGGVPVDPIIMALQRKHLPYIFVSAFPVMVGPYKDAVFLDKPCTAKQLLKAPNGLALTVGNAEGELDPAKYCLQRNFSFHEGLAPRVPPSAYIPSCTQSSMICGNEYSTTMNPRAFSSRASVTPRAARLIMA